MEKISVKINKYMVLKLNNKLEKLETRYILLCNLSYVHFVHRFT